MALAQLAWSYPGDSEIDLPTLEVLLQQFDEGSVQLAVALALEAHGHREMAGVAYLTTFSEAAPAAPRGASSQSDP